MRAKILYSIPVFWFAGVASLAYHAVSVFLFSSKSEKTKIPKLLLPLLVFVAVYVFSLAANFYQSPVDRFVASIYNLSLWVSGIMVASSYFVYYNQIEKQAKVLLFSILAAALLCFFTNSEIVLKSLVSMAISTDSLPPLIKDTVMLKVFTSDWFDASVNYRNSIFSPYSTATGAMAIILLAIATNNISSRSREFFFLFVVAFICAASTFSRISVFVVVLYAVLRLYLDLPRNYRKFLLFSHPLPSAFVCRKFWRL
ncbi:hypothetical protein [Marinobacterium aestuariivivens]|uniref:Polymerase n=1 Tax=Marinobacterium aestuariivivens TaxID=1698799 RepID=A0ABW1ZZD4_9GAMM